MDVSPSLGAYRIAFWLIEVRGLRLRMSAETANPIVEIVDRDEEDN